MDLYVRTAEKVAREGNCLLQRIKKRLRAIRAGTETQFKKFNIPDKMLMKIVTTRTMKIEKLS